MNRLSLEQKLTIEAMGCFFTKSILPYFLSFLYTCVKTDMKIVILGAGKTGSYVASVLSEEEHDVILIDNDAKILERIGREIDVATIHATAPSPKLFEELAENAPDLFFAVTGDDETNLVSCSIAKNLGFPKTVAKVENRQYIHYPRLDF